MGQAGPHSGRTSVRPATTTLKFTPLGSRPRNAPALWASAPPFSRGKARAKTLPSPPPEGSTTARTVLVGTLHDLATSVGPDTRRSCAALRRAEPRAARSSRFSTDRAERLFVRGLAPNGVNLRVVVAGRTEVRPEWGPACPM